MVRSAGSPTASMSALALNRPSRTCGMSWKAATPITISAVALRIPHFSTPRMRFGFRAP